MSGRQNVAVQNGITALAGGGQTGATQLINGLNRITTVATIADSALLPPAMPGAVVWVKNAAANSANVFPSKGDAINALAADAALAVAGAAFTGFYCILTGTWESK